MDKTPPAVVGYTPPDAATGVDLNPAVELVFSEDMDRSRVEEALFISPAVDFRPRWAGRRLRLDFAEELAADRTYVLTVGTGARDRRNNALPSAFTLAFATGERLNRGLLRGAVYRTHRPASTIHVWAYAVEADGSAFGTGLRPGVDPPQYQTQTDAGGTFEFSRLSAGRYLLCAFEDRRRNGVWDEGEELALPAGVVEVDEEQAAVAGDLLLQARGEGEVRLERLQALDRRRLLLYFTADVDPDSVKVVVKGLAVEAVYGKADDGQKVYVSTGMQEEGREYGMQLLVGGRTLAEEAAWRGSGRIDARPPQVVSFSPGPGGGGPAAVPTLSFDEPMRREKPQGALEAVRDESGEPQAGTWQWAGPRRLEFVPGAPLQAGSYRLRIESSSLADREGVALADSALQWNFDVPSSGVLAGVNGVIVGERPATAVLLGEDRSYRTTSAADGFFAFAAVAAGTYVLYAFADEDGDGRVGGGRVEPFAFAEAYGRRGEKLKLEEGALIEGVELVLR